MSFLLQEASTKGGGGCGGGAIDAPVEAKHDDHWNPEGSERRVDDISRLRSQFTSNRKRCVVLGGRRLVVGGYPVLDLSSFSLRPSDERRKTDDEGKDPDADDQHLHSNR